VRTAKGGNWFCFPEYIPAEMDKLFLRLGRPPFLRGSIGADFVLAAAEFLGDLNAIHPFREGNGRSQLAFMHLVALRAGHPLRLQLIKRASFLPAMIRSFEGDYRPLADQLGAIRA
jgi:cell filamentation protein